MPCSVEGGDARAPARDEDVVSEGDGARRVEEDVESVARQVLAVQEHGVVPYSPLEHDPGAEPRRTVDAQEDQLVQRQAYGRSRAEAASPAAD